MKKLFLALALFSNSASADPWKLVWSDDFTGGIDPQKWMIRTGGDGGGNDELQYYTDLPTNTRVEDGKLVVEARRERFGDKAYTSARLLSLGSWTYGRFEVRAKLPAGRGTWPGIWMMPSNPKHNDGAWPDNGEIDIMEHVGFDYGVVHGSLHMEAFNWIIGNEKTATIRVPNVDSEFHTYALEWLPNGISMYVDDVRYMHYDNPHLTYKEWPYDTDFHFIVNLAIGGSWGGSHGVDDAIFPTRMTIESVKVYQQAGFPAFHYRASPRLPFKR